MTHLRSFLKRIVSAVFPRSAESDTMTAHFPLFPSYFHDFRSNPWEKATGFPPRFAMEKGFETSLSLKASASVTIL
jgi:hypothetical protein